MHTTPTLEEQVAELYVLVARLSRRVERAVQLTDMIPNPILRKLIKSKLEAD